MKSPRARRLSIVALTMIIVIIPFCLYYLFFVESQTSYFTGRDFRVLADIGGQIKSKIDNLGTSVINAANKASKDRIDNSKPGKMSNGDELKEALDLIKKSGVNLKYDQNALKSVKLAPVQEEAPTAKIAQRPATPNQNANANHYVSVGAPTQTPVTNSSARSAAKTRAYSAKPGESTNDAIVRITSKAEQGSFWLDVEYRGNQKGVGSFHVECEISSLVDPFAERYVIDELNQTHERLFDDVLVAEAQTGRVIFERSQPGLRILSLATLSNKKGEKLELADRSSTIELAMAGADYNLFQQPLSLTLADSKSDEEVKWLVCGLTRTDHFRDETYAVSYTVLIIFVFIISLSVLSWPLLKLKLMGPKDRLRRADLGLTFACGLLGTALLVFLMLDIGSYISLEEILDSQLKELSGTISSNFHKEIRKALKQLGQLNEQLSADEKKEHPDSSWDTEAEKLIASHDPKAVAALKLLFPEKLNLLAETLDWSTTPYPYFNSVTWIDSEGLQRIKWTTMRDNTAFVNVAERAYFTNARNGDLWKRANGEYVVDLVYSKGTGENVAVVATRAGETRWVSSIDERLLSLMGPVLPAGYGFAVLDNEGDVLFHSDEVKNLQEQFFEECDNDLILRAAVTARTNELVNANYLGSSHRLFVSPLAGTPWVLVAFRDKQIGRTANLELLTLSVVSYLIFALLVLIIVACIYLPNRCEVIGWLWPSPKRLWQYNLIVVLNALLGAAFLLALILWNKMLLVVLCFLVPTLAIILGAVILKNPAGQANKQFIEWFKKRPFPSHRTAYLIALVAYMALLSVLPTIGFFRVARAFEMNLMVKQGQVSLAKGLERRIQNVSSQYNAITIGKEDAGKTGFLARRLDPGPDNSNWDVYDTFFFKSNHTAPFGVSTSPNQNLDWIDYSLKELRPLYNQSCVESQELPYAASADQIWVWGTDEQGKQVLQKYKDGRPGELSVAVTSAGGVPYGFSVKVINLIAALVLAALIYLLARSVARHFFLLDQVVPKPAFAGPPALPKDRNVVLIQAPGIGGKVWDDPARFKRVDLSQVEKWEGWAQTLKPGRRAAGVALVLDHFEHCLDEPVATREKLQAIEQFLSEGTRIIVASTIDPLRFSLAADKGTAKPASNSKQSDKKEKKDKKGPPTDKPSKESDQARWSLIFSDFVTLYEPDMADPAFEKSHKELMRNLKTNDAWRYLERMDSAIIGDQQSLSNGYKPNAVIEEKINQVVEQAQAYHQALWATCSQDERCTLIHIALDGMVSVKNQEVRQLMKRGLVARDPGLRLMDESFRRFVISISHGEDIDAWRQADGGSTWQLIKVPILLVLLSISVFLFLTQKELYDSTISLVSALTAGVAILFRFLGMFQKSGAGAAPQT